MELALIANQSNISLSRFLPLRTSARGLVWDWQLFMASSCRTMDVSMCQVNPAPVQPSIFICPATRNAIDCRCKASNKKRRTPHLDIRLIHCILPGCQKAHSNCFLNSSINCRRFATSTCRAVTSSSNFAIRSFSAITRCRAASGAFSA